MQASDHTQPDIPPDEDLDKLHEKVNAMLDVPLPKEGDAWPLPVEDSLPVADDADPKPLPRAGAT